MRQTAKSPPPISSHLRLFGDAMQRQIETFIQIAGFDAELRVEFTVTSWGCPAQLYGPPENCWPAEDPEFEIDEIGVTLTIGGLDCAEWIVPHRCAQFRLLANHPRVDEAIVEAIGEIERPSRRRLRSRRFA